MEPSVHVTTRVTIGGYPYIYVVNRRVTTGGYPYIYVVNKRVNTVGYPYLYAWLIVHTLLPSLACLNPARPTSNHPAQTNLNQSSRMGIINACFRENLQPSSPWRF